MESAIAGIILEKYKLLSKLSKGGMATVYLAEHALLKKKVAIKILLPDLAKNSDMVERFLREARAAAGLNHPNIIKIHDVGKVKKIHYIAMDFIDGPRLTDHIAREGKLSEAEILRISRQVLGAIDEAHNNQVIHRDLKPHNIMLDHRGDVVIMDFGIAKAAYNSDMTATGSFLGTAKYASPEQVRGDKITPTSDLYSWGIVMYEMATGQTPFTGKDVTTLIYQHLHKSPSSPREVNPELSTELNDIILKCLEKEPEKRYPTAAELCSQINQLTSKASWAGITDQLATAALIDEKTKALLSGLGKVRTDHPKARRRKALWLSLLSIILISIGGLAWWSIGIKHSPDKSQTTAETAKATTAQTWEPRIIVSTPDAAKTQAQVQVWTEKKRYRIGEKIVINFRSRDDGYLFLYHENALGRGTIIFPIRPEEDNFVIGGLTNTIPDPDAAFVFLIQLPTGTNRIKALATSSKEQAQAWRTMDEGELLNAARKQKDVLIFEVVN